jgi:hypothetical protein
MVMRLGLGAGWQQHRADQSGAGCSAQQDQQGMTH